MLCVQQTVGNATLAKPEGARSVHGTSTSDSNGDPWWRRVLTGGNNVVLAMVVATATGRPQRLVESNAFKPLKIRETFH